ISHKDHDAIPRKKRNVLFPSGVKLCAEESVQQSIANHLSYFHLRVCQETVWEAFKIFWDRLPNQEEYQTWMSQCLNGTATALAMGNNFSQSKEHLALIESVSVCIGDMSLSSLHEITIIMYVCNFYININPKSDGFQLLFCVCVTIKFTLQLPS
ncbi:unnamed protein product, partial [Coregonus sp. 'balchen']